MSTKSDGIMIVSVYCNPNILWSSWNDRRFSAKYVIISWIYASQDAP